MSVNNVYAVSDAIKYINGQSTITDNTSIIDGIKDSMTSPISLFFLATGAKAEIGKGYSATAEALAATTEKKRLEGLLKTLKNNGTAGEIESCKTAIKQQKKIAKPSISNIFKWIKGDAKNVGVGIHFGLDATEVAAQKANARTLKGFKELFKEKFFSTADAVPKNTKKGIFSKVTSGAKNLLLKIPGASKVANSAFGKGVSKVFKGSGTGLMVAIDGVMEIFTNVIPAFKQGGVASGVKQIAKSSVKVSSSTVGMVLGSKGGTALGSAIGTAICPGLGTAIGGAIGSFVGGLIGSAIIGGICNKIAGKSEVEKMQEEENELVAQNVANDQASMSELNTLVAQKVQEDIASGNITEDTEKMAAYLNSGVFSSGVSSYPLSGSNNQNEYYTNPVSVSATTSSNTQNMNWLNDAVARMQSGDTSIYNISNEKLNSMLGNYQSDTIQNNQSNSVNYYT